MLFLPVKASFEQSSNKTYQPDPTAQLNLNCHIIVLIPTAETKVIFTGFFCQIWQGKIRKNGIVQPHENGDISYFFFRVKMRI